MRKLISMMSLLALVAFALPACSDNDDFTEVAKAVDLEKEAPSGDDDREDGDQGPGGG